MATETLVPLEIPNVPVVETFRDTINKNRARLSGLLTSGNFAQAIRSWSNGEANCFVSLAYINSHLN
jgi:hypothetical protein